jgi:hypothetical protein
MKRKNGFALSEALIVIMMVAILVGTIGFGFVVGICMGNEWYSEDGVLRELRFIHPKVTRIVHTERHIWAYSVIVVDEGGIPKTYLLDSNIEENYRFHEAK